MNLWILQVICSLVSIQQYHFRCHQFPVFFLNEAYFFNLLDTFKYCESFIYNREYIALLLRTFAHPYK